LEELVDELEFYHYYHFILWGDLFGEVELVGLSWLGDLFKLPGLVFLVDEQYYIQLIIPNFTI